MTNNEREQRARESIEAKLKDLIIQATTERSHFYVRQVCVDAIAEIEKLKGELEKTKEEKRVYQGELRKLESRNVAEEIRILADHQGIELLNHATLLAEALEYHIQQTRSIEKSEQALAAYKKDFTK